MPTRTHSSADATVQYDCCIHVNKSHHRIAYKVRISTNKDKHETQMEPVNE